MGLSEHQHDWEALGEIDPLWAILSKKEMRHGKWNIETFFKTGEEEVSSVLKRTEGHNLPVKKARVLDFGCGIGRLSRAFSKEFDEVVGLDISKSMLEKGKKFNEDKPAISFVHNAEPNLKLFPSEHFDMIYSNIVLQHIPANEVIEEFIREFVRVLAPGGIGVFQLPSSRGWRVRINPRRRAYIALKTVGFSSAFLLEKLNLSPIHMSSVPKERVIDLIQSSGGRLLEARSVNAGGPHVVDFEYYFTKDSKESK